MRILHVIASLAPRYGGPSTVVPEMAAALADRGHHVEILTTDIDGPGRLPVQTGRPLERRGVATTFFRVHHPRGYKVSLGLWRALRRRVHEFDVVHVHSLYLFHTLVAGHYCRRFGVPYLLRPHGTLDPWHRRRHRWRKAIYTAILERRNLRAAAGIHYTSTAERDHASAIHSGAVGFVVPLGVDALALNRPIDHARLLDRQPRLAGRTLVTFLGRLARKKRLDLLLDAFAAVASNHPQAQLVLAGPDDEGAGHQLRTRIATLGLEARVALLGFVDGDAKIALLQRSRVFVLPSEDENFGVAVVEAMATGVPVVVTEGVAIHREITAAGAGLVVASTAGVLSAAIGRLLNDAELATSMGERGRALVDSAFAWSRIAVELERVYQKAIASRTRKL